MGGIVISRWDKEFFRKINFIKYLFLIDTKYDIHFIFIVHVKYNFKL